MKKLTGIGVLLCAAATVPGLDPAQLAGAGASSRSAPVTVGTFDSRALAVAHVRSAAFAEELTALRAELEEARAAGNDERVRELEELGPELQARAHGQAFGTDPVDDILARIDDRLPAIAEEAGVDLVVSTWDLAYRKPKLELVDVTDLLVAEFDPDQATLDVIEDVRAADPVRVHVHED